MDDKEKDLEVINDDAANSKVETVRLNVRVPKDIYNYFKAKSDRTGVSMSALVYLALEDYLNQRTMMEQMPDLLKMAEKFKKD